MRKATKIFISFAVVLIAGLNFIVSAFAQDPFSSIAIGGLGGASGAGLFSSMAGMSGIDINWNGSTADPLDAMWNVLNPDHVYFSGEKHEADPQTYPEDIWDYITVDIGDWLDAQSDFIINFAQTYNVDNNDQGSVSVARSYAGYEFNNLVSGYYAGAVVGTFELGAVFRLGPAEWRVVNGSVPSYAWVEFYINDVLQSTYNYAGKNSVYGYPVAFATTGPNSNLITIVCGSTLALHPWQTYNAAGLVNPAVNVPWTSTTVNTSIFDGWESAKVKIPHSISQLHPGWTVPEFMEELDRIWYGAGEDSIVIEDGGNPPVPPVPIPDTPLGEVPFDDWVDLWGQGIYQQLENQSDALDLIGSNGIDAIEELESIDTNTEDLVEVAESIDTNIGVGNGILGGIRSLAQSAVNYLEGIAEHVGELVEEIVEGTETLIAGILNQIPQAFGVIFGPIKQASSIWHYVVEWIQSIGAPFQFIWSMASGTSYYIILPVYASLAAAVVLAFFKRFGR